MEASKNMGLNDLSVAIRREYQKVGVGARRTPEEIDYLSELLLNSRSACQVSGVAWATWIKGVLPGKHLSSIHKIMNKSNIGRSKRPVPASSYDNFEQEIVLPSKTTPQNFDRLKVVVGNNLIDFESPLNIDSLVNKICDKIESNIEDRIFKLLEQRVLNELGQRLVGTNVES